MAAVTICNDFGVQENTSLIVSLVSPSIYHEVVGPDAKILVFRKLTFQPAFSLSSFTFIKRIFSSSSLSAIRVVSSAYLRLLIFLLKSWFQLVLHSIVIIYMWYIISTTKQLFSSLKSVKMNFFFFFVKTVIICSLILSRVWYNTVDYYHHAY